MISWSPTSVAYGRTIQSVLGDNAIPHSRDLQPIVAKMEGMFKAGHCSMLLTIEGNAILAMRSSFL